MFSRKSLLTSSVFLALTLASHFAAAQSADSRGTARFSGTPTLAAGSGGGGATWLTGSLSALTTYTNSAAYPIQVYARLEGACYAGGIEVDGVLVSYGNNDCEWGGTTVTAIVPAGSSFRVTTGSIAIRVLAMANNANWQQIGIYFQTGTGWTWTSVTRVNCLTAGQKDVGHGYDWTTYSYGNEVRSGVYYKELPAMTQWGYAYCDDTPPPPPGWDYGGGH